MNIKKTLELQERAKKIIPGMTQLLSKRPDMFSMDVWPAYFKKAQGVNVWDLDGNKYVDMSIGGIGANVLGYCDPDVDAAVIGVIKSGTSSSLNGPEDVELAELLCELHPWSDMIRYARTGGEAMAISVRIARAKTGKDIVAFCGYHGWHDWYLAANLSTDSALDGHLIPGLNPAGVPRRLQGTAYPFAYNNLDGLTKIVEEHGKNLAAIVIEPIRNFKPDFGFIEGIREIANETGAVFIVDEISAAFRINTGGAHLNIFPEKNIPDIAVFSKALGNGYPIAAIIGKSNVMEAAQNSFISSTYWTERIGPAAAIATIKKHRTVDAGKHLVALGEKVQQGWAALGARHGFDLEIAGMKPMSHFSFKQEENLELKALYIQLMLEKGILASNLFYAMYAHTMNNVDEYLTATDEAFSQIRIALDRGIVKDVLKGQPSQAGFKRLS